MSVRSFDATCLLAFAIGIGVIFVAYGPMGFFSRWLGTRSHIDARTAKEEGVPVWITGTFERLLAFFLVVLHVEGAYALIALWLGAKLAASWHRLPTEPTGTPKATMSNGGITDRLGLAPYVRSSQALSQS